jgi:hypothetical protein
MLTPAFFGTVVGAAVADVHQQRVGTGQVGMSVRCVLDYVGGPRADRPSSVVVKLPSDDETSRATGIALRNYEREVGFYRELASTVAVRAPQCWYADWDPVGGGFVLVLEDLAPAEQGDQVAGCSVDAAALALGELAALHGPRWGDERLAAIEWLQRRLPEDTARLQGLYGACVEPFVARYGDRLDPSQVALARRFTTAIPAFMESSVGPFTVTHGDFRLDNLLFGTEAGGDPVAVVDWQTPGMGMGLADVSYFLGAGLLVEDRRRHERDLLEHYREALAGRGVTTSSEACWRQYRAFAFSGVVMSVVASMIVGQTPRGDEMFVAMGSRHLQHALDLDALDALGPT